jgi:hypothetical protein
MKRPPRPHPLNQHAHCYAFNRVYPPGHKVNVRLDSGEIRETKTKTRAEVLQGHSAVIWLEGITGCYLLDRVTPIVEAVHG